MTNSYRKKAIIILTDEDLMTVGIDPDTVSDDEFDEWAANVGHELESLDYYTELLLSHLPVGATTIGNDVVEKIPAGLEISPDW